MSDIYTKPEHGWTCFYCGETLKTFGAARDHFGSDPLAYAGCQIKAGEERGLLMAIRKAESELQAYRNETDAASLAYYARQSAHAQELIAAEQSGYDKGLRDGRLENKT